MAVTYNILGRLPKPGAPVTGLVRPMPPTVKEQRPSATAAPQITEAEEPKPWTRPKRK